MSSSKLAVPPLPPESQLPKFVSTPLDMKLLVYTKINLELELFLVLTLKSVFFFWGHPVS